jgi:hypothetical protein
MFDQNIFKENYFHSVQISFVTGYIHNTGHYI